MTARLLIVLSLTIVLTPLGLGSPAYAQDAPGEAKRYGTNATPPDAVRLKNGGLLRGTISELIPGDSVVLLTATGEVRRFPMSEVDYAGPAAGLPGATAAPRASAPAAADDGRITVSLRANQPEITFHQRIASEISTGAAVSFGLGLGVGGGGGGARGGVGFTPYASSGATFTPLCVAPCELAMSPGTYYLGLSLDDGMPVSDNRPVVVAPGATAITGAYKSHEELRVAGWLVGTTTFLGGGALLTWSVVTGAQQCSTTNTCILPDDRVAPVIGGLSIMVGGAIIAYVLTSFIDEIELTVE